MEQVNKFDFSAIEPIKIKDVKIGKESYTLHEASEDAACRYRNKVFSGTRLGPEGRAERIENIADADPLLLSCCLTSDKDDKLVPLSVILKWPSRIVKPLIEKLKEISDLDSDEDPMKVAIKAALSKESSPISYDDFCRWVGNWTEIEKDSKTLSPLFKVLKPSIEELAKNELESGTDSLG